MTGYDGECFCGAVKFHCDSEPLFTQHCHCNKCREIAALSKRGKDKVGYAWTAGYLRKNFRITGGINALSEVIRNNAKLFVCKNCHSLIYGISLDADKQAGIGINVNNFHFFGKTPVSFEPLRHVYYVNRIVNVNDGLPKFKDAPAEQNGSGELYE